MAHPNALPDDVADAELAGWDWRAALKLHPVGRFGGLTWLAEATETPRRTVYSYSRGDRPTPVRWLRDVASALRIDEA